MAAATVNWTRAEIEEALDAVSASSTVRGRKKVLEELTRARAKVPAKENPKARVVIRFGERPAALLADVLAGRPSPATRPSYSAAYRRTRRPAANIWPRYWPPRAKRRVLRRRIAAAALAVLDLKAP